MKGNILDLVLNNSDTLIYNFSVDAHNIQLIFSDHIILHSVYHVLSIDVLNSSQILYLTTPSLISSEYIPLHVADFTDYLTSTKTKSAWHSFCDILKDTLLLFIPKVRLRSYQHPKVDSNYIIVIC